MTHSYAWPIWCVVGLSVLTTHAAMGQHADDGNELPSLDDLLGIDTHKSDEHSNDSQDTQTDTIGHTRPHTQELDRLLSGKEIVDALTKAIDLMDRSARRLGDEMDPGIATQRMQQRVLDQLDRLIADAQNRSSQSNPSSSKSQSNAQKQNQSTRQPSQQSKSQHAGNKENNGQVNPPASSKASLKAAQAADLATWGQLPARLRDALLQGSSDSFSATYKALTEAYYKKLAEEPKQ